MSCCGKNRLTHKAIEARFWLVPSLFSFSPFSFSEHNGGKISRERSGMGIWRAGAGRDGAADINKHAIPGQVPRPPRRGGGYI